LGYTVYEPAAGRHELLGQITSGRCSEIFACRDSRNRNARSPHWLTQMAACTNRGHKRHRTPVRDALLAIQERRAPDSVRLDQSAAGMSGLQRIGVPMSRWPS